MSEPNNEPIQDVIKAREILLYDDADRLRLSMSCYSDPEINLYSQDGKQALTISTLEQDGNSRRITFWGKHPQFRAMIFSRDNGVGCTFYDKDGKNVGTVGYVDGEGWFKNEP